MAPTTVAPTVCRMVVYVLSAADVQAINQKSGGFPANEHREGDELAAVVVRTWTGDCVNLQVLLDGEGTYWATSRHAGDRPGTWHWPSRN